MRSHRHSRTRTAILAVLMAVTVVVGTVAVADTTVADSRVNNPIGPTGTVYLGEEDVDLSAVAGTPPDGAHTFFGVSGAAVGDTATVGEVTSADITVANNFATGGYNATGTTGDVVLTVEEPVVTDLTIFGGAGTAGPNVTNGSILESQDEITLQVDWNFDAAENVSIQIEDEQGLAIQDGLNGGAGVDDLVESGDTVVVSGIGDLDTGEYTVTAAGADALDGASRSATFTIVSDDQVVTTCREINESGTYVLGADITEQADTCISIVVSDVTLDGQGHTLDGNEEGEVAVGVVDDDGGSLSNVTVRNLVITDWGVGISYQFADDGRIEDNVINETSERGDFDGQAIQLSDSDGTVVARNNVTGVMGPGGAGISLDGSDGGTELIDNTVTGVSDGVGIGLDGGAGTQVRGNTVTDVLDGIGISLSDGTTGNELSNNTVADVTGDSGIFLSETAGNELSDNVVSNATVGIEVADGSDDNTFEDNTANGNRGDGIVVSFSDGNTFVNNTASGNEGDGVSLISSAGNAFTDTTARNNGGWAFYSEGGPDSNPVRTLDIGASTEPATTLTFENYTNVALGPSGGETPPAGRDDIGRFVAVESTGTGESFVFLNVSYDDTDHLSVNESTLTLWAFEGGPTADPWGPVGGVTGVDTAENYVFGNVTDPSGVDVVAPLGVATPEISACRVIDDPGQYELVADIVDSPFGTCIDIRSGDVVFDGGGHVVDGVGGDGTRGIRAESPDGTDVPVDVSNVTVRNVTVSDWGVGVEYVAATDTALQDVVATGNEPWAFRSFGGTDTVAENVVINPTLSFEATDVALGPVETPPPDPPGQATVGEYLNATNTADGSVLNLTMGYSQSNVTDRNVLEQTLQLWRYNGTWSEVPGSTVDTTNDTVSAEITEFSVFAPAGLVDDDDGDGGGDGGGGGGAGGGGGNTAPTSEFENTPDAPSSNASVTFDASGSSDPDGTIDEYRWDFDGDGIVDRTSTTPTVTHTYTVSGVYTVSLSVADNDGAVTTASRQVTVNRAPVADFDHSPAEPLAASPVTFDAANSSDPDGTIDEYRWDFDGDGIVDRTSTTPTVTTEYAEPGNYTVVLSVEDDDGAVANASGTVNVTQPTETPTDGGATGGATPTPTATATPTETGLATTTAPGTGTDTDEGGGPALFGIPLWLLVLLLLVLVAAYVYRRSVQLRSG